jgi:hypothetical protein
LVFSFIDSQPAASIPIDGGLVVITEVISGGFFSESAVDRFFQVVNGALDRLIHGAFLMRYHYGLAPVAACCPAPYAQALSRDRKTARCL